MSAICTGIMFGSTIGNLISGLILFYIPGWEPVFYIYGTIGCMWCVYWYLVVYSTPTKHPFVTEEEKTMILAQSKLHVVNLLYEFSQFTSFSFIIHCLFVQRE